MQSSCTKRLPDQLLPLVSSSDLHPGTGGLKKAYGKLTTIAVFTGGMNHPTRGIYYFILHLLRAGVQPIFAFDGPNKPAEKGVYTVPAKSAPKSSPDAVSARAGTRTSFTRTESDIQREYFTSEIIKLTKELLNLLGLPWIIASGEAEAECANLEKMGLVDAVLTLDGDTFVFGSKTVLQKLDANDKVAMVYKFDMKDLLQAGLRHRDLVMLALMAGGDYDKGIQGCGHKLAIEAAQLGYSRELEVLLDKNLPLTKWKNRLAEELRSNSGGRFSAQHAHVAGSIARNVSFPSPKIASYYLRPAVSPRDILEKYRKPDEWLRHVRVTDLRRWTETHFNWRFRHFAGKFVKLLAPALLARLLLLHGQIGTDGSYLIEYIDRQKAGESDALHELRVRFQPLNVVGVDFTSHESIHKEFQANMKDEPYEPEQFELEWMPAWIVEQGAPGKHREWNEAQLAKASKKPVGKKREMTETIPNTGDATGPRPKKPRGRPRKAASDSPGVGNTPTSNAIEATPQAKRPRGRPRKNPHQNPANPSMPPRPANKTSLGTSASKKNESVLPKNIAPGSQEDEPKPAFKDFYLGPSSEEEG